MKWGLLSILVVQGCDLPTLEGEARSRASLDLHCPSEQIAIYEASHRSTVARGCGAWTQYTCFYSSGHFICIPELPAQVNTSSAPSPTPTPAP